MPAPSSLESLSTTYADNYPAGTDTYDPSALDDTLRVHAGAIARLRDQSRDEGVSIEDLRYGGVADDSTNNITPMTDALAGNSVVYLGTGTYRFTVTSGSADGINISAGHRKIVGRGKNRTTMKFVLSGTTATSLIRVSSGSLHIEGVNIEVVNPDGAVVYMFDGGSLSNFVARDCKFNGGMTNSGATLSYNAVGLRVRDSAVLTSILVENCEILRFKWFFYKTNTGTTDQARIKFLHNDFYEHYRTPLLFNTPAGGIDDVLVHGNTFRDNLGDSASQKNHFHIAIDGTNIRVTDNHMYGPVQEAIHIEEGPDRMVISGNTIQVDGDGIFFTDNDNGGSDHSAQDVVIANNVITKTGTLQAVGSAGIWLVNNDGGEIFDDDGNPTGTFYPVYTPGMRVKITGNVITGFENGIMSDCRIEDGGSISGNDVHDCTYGFRQTNSNTAFDGNRSIHCTYAVRGQQGACFRNHGIVSCDNLASDAGRWVMFINPYFEWDASTIGATSAIYHNIMPLSSTQRFGGTISSHAATSTEVDTVFAHDYAKYDGTTLTVNSGSWDDLELTRATGAATLTTMENAGYLAVRLYSTSARTNVRVVSHVNGVILAAA